MITPYVVLINDINIRVKVSNVQYYKVRLLIKLVVTLTSPLVLISVKVTACYGFV